MKIAIINNWPHQYMGGVEKYTQMLIEMCNKNGWTVHEYSIIKPNTSKVLKDPIKGVKQFDISNGAVFYPFSANKKVKKIVDSNEYDLVIGNSITNSHTDKSDKYVHVQHMDNKFYSYKSSFRWYMFCNAFFMGLGSLRNPIKQKNVMFYTEKHIDKAVKNPMSTPLPLPSNFELRKKPIKGRNITWIARHEEPHKGLKNLSKIWQASKYKESFVIGGDGPNTKSIKVSGGNLVGRLTPNQVKDALDNSAVFIMTSNFEGFGFTLVEALSRGIPVILFDTFVAAKFFSECEAVTLIKSKDFVSYDNAINKIIEMDDMSWKTLSNDAIKFSEKRFSKDVFNETWTKYIKSLTK